jgi:hypothetical protein
MEMLAGRAHYFDRLVVCTTDSASGDVRQIGLSQEVPVLNTSKDNANDLACLRLASELMQMSRDTFNSELQAHCIQMAKYWSDQADRDMRPNVADPKIRRLS